MKIAQDIPALALSRNESLEGVVVSAGRNA
jgi:hypothetical protein